MPMPERAKAVAKLLLRMTEAERGRLDVLCGDVHHNTGPKRAFAHAQLNAFIEQVAADEGPFGDRRADVPAGGDRLDGAVVRHQPATRVAVTPRWANVVIIALLALYVVFIVFALVASAKSLR